MFYYYYPVNLTLEENGTFIAEIENIPEVRTIGKNKNNAFFWIKDALILCLNERKKYDIKIPKPLPPKDGQKCVEIGLKFMII